MGRKGKTQKHTAAETKAKHKAAKEARGAAGGGSEGASKRNDEKNKKSVPCQICKLLVPNLVSMKNHYEAKHPKNSFDEDMYSNLFGIN